MTNKFKEELSQRFNLPKLNKPKNCIIIEIDGLDACGKETFSKSLKFELEKVTSNSYSYVHIERLSFPDYEGNEYAGEIYKELRRDTPTYTREELDGLYFLDRYHTMKKIYSKCVELDRTYIFILDRYMLSNCIYTHLPFMGQDERTLNKATKLAYDTLYFEVDKIGGIDYLAVIYVPEQSTDFHHSLIEAKRERNETDNNETFEKQDFLAEILRERIIFNTSRFTQKLLYPCVSANNMNVFRIPIGSTFNGNTEWEEKIITQLLPRFKSREEITFYATGSCDDFSLSLRYRPVIRLLENVELMKVGKDDIDLLNFNYKKLFEHYYDGEVLYLKDLMPKIIPIVAFIHHTEHEHKDYICTNVKLDLSAYTTSMKYDHRFSKEIIGNEFTTYYYPIEGYNVKYYRELTDYLSVNFKFEEGKEQDLKPGLKLIGYVLLERVE